MKNTTAYKVDFVMFIIINMVFFYIFFALWKTIYTESGVTQINSYSLTNTVTYYFITSFIFRFDLAGAIYMGENIWDGYFTNDLIKPWSVKAIEYIYTFAEILLNVLIYLPFWFFMYLTARPYISFPTWQNAVFFVITLLLAFLMNMAFNLIFHSLTFYYGDQDSTINLVNYLGSFLGGGVFPLIFLAGAAGRIFNILPFKYLFDIPAGIYLGKLSLTQIYQAWGWILIWTAVFYIIFYFVYKNGLKRYTGTGR